MWFPANFQIDPYQLLTILKIHNLKSIGTSCGAISWLKQLPSLPEALTVEQHMHTYEKLVVNIYLHQAIQFDKVITAQPKQKSLTLPSTCPLKTSFCSSNSTVMCYAGFIGKVAIESICQKIQQLVQKITVLTSQQLQELCK